MIKAVIFDLDGTLIDSIDMILQTLDLALKQFGVHGDLNRAEQMVGMNPWKIIEEITGLKSFEEQDRIVQEWAKRYLSAILKNNAVSLSDGVVELFEELKRKNIKIGIASSLSKSFIQKLIRHYGIESFIDAFVGNDEVKNSKPAPDIFIETAKRLNVRPSDCIVVGDAEYDIIGGNKMGAITVLYNPRSRPYNSKAKPTYVIRHISKVLSFLS